MQFSVGKKDCVKINLLQRGYELILILAILMTDSSLSVFASMLAVPSDLKLHVHVSRLNRAANGN